MGWESVQTNGRTLIYHDGGTANFQCSVFFDPQAKIAVFVAANVMCALDAFSSPHGSDPLDGTTTRGMAQTVLAMVTNQPLPEQGRGIRRLYLLFDLVILTLTVLLVMALVRIPMRYRRLERGGIASRSRLVWRVVLVLMLHLIWPLILLYLLLHSINWRVFVTLYQPDLGYWLYTVAVIVFLKGLIEIGLLWRLFRQTHQLQIGHSA